MEEYNRNYDHHFLRNGLNSTIMVRAFLALELSDEIRQALASAQEILRQSPARLTFVDPALIHITVKFLGEVDEKIIPRIITAIREIPFEPFTVNAGIVTANNRYRPRTVWSVIGDKGKGELLAGKVEDALEPLGFARETRKFTPHATVARVKSFDPSLFRQLDLLKDRTYGDCIISGIKLKKSTLSGKGPVYEDLMEAAW